MEYVLLDSANDKLYIMFLDTKTWFGKLYLRTHTLNFDKQGYLDLIVYNKDIQYLGVL
jgi:hypothetical protein